MRIPSRAPESYDLLSGRNLALRLRLLLSLELPLHACIFPVALR